eukprot:43896-Eustigmatos_ZCMA.PRE.1
MRPCHQWYWCTCSTCAACDVEGGQGREHPRSAVCRLVLELHRDAGGGQALCPTAQDVPAGGEHARSWQWWQVVDLAVRGVVAEGLRPRLHRVG